MKNKVNRPAITTHENGIQLCKQVTGSMNNIFMTKKKQCQGSNTVWKQVFTTLPIKRTHLECRYGELTLGKSESLSLPGLQALQLKDYATGKDLRCWVMEQCYNVEYLCFVMRPELCMQGKPTATTPTYIPPAIFNHSTANNFQYIFLVNMETKNRDPHFCGKCNSRHAFRKGQVTIYFGKCPSPGQIKHVVTWWCSTSFQLTSNSAWIGAMEIARFIEDVHMPGDHIPQTWHSLISNCTDTWRSRWISRNCTHNMNSQRAWWQWCSCMKQPQTHTESNMFHFKEGWLRIVNAVNHFKQQAN
jgi:hypothetical protein